MTAAVLEASGDDRYAVRGPLRFDSVPALWRTTRDIFREGATVTVDFGAVGDVDSAGLALLVEWMRDARARGARVRYENLPAQMQAMARVSGLDGLLP